jgi:hypothetical protein
LRQSRYITFPCFLDFSLYVKKTLEKTEAIQELTINTGTMGTQDTERRPTKEKHNTENKKDEQHMPHQ